MTTAAEIIRRGFREGNFVAIGDSPSTEEKAEGLTVLQGIVDTVFPLVVGAGLIPWHIPLPQRTSTVAANYPALPGDFKLPSTHNVNNPPPNSRLMMKNTTDTTVYFQYQAQDGAIMEYVDVNHTANVTLDANGALFGVTGVETQVVITPDGAGRNRSRKWVFRGDLGAWVEVETLIEAAEMPFPVDFDDFFVTELAIRMTGPHGNEPRGATILRNREMKTFLRTRYTQMAEVWYNNPAGHTQQTWSPTSVPNSFDLGG